MVFYIDKEWMIIMYNKNTKENVKALSSYLSVEKNEYVI